MLDNLIIYSYMEFQLKRVIYCILLSCFMVSAQDDQSDGATTPSNRNNSAPSVRIGDSNRGPGLAPTTWGFIAQYSGTAYGTGYFPFSIDGSYLGTNSIYGITFNYVPTYINDLRAVYAFDVSGLMDGGGPTWSSFMFDTRETPPVGTVNSAAFANIALTTDGTNFALEGLSLFSGNGANLDIFDAEDLEDGAPFANPALAFTGNNPLIGSMAISSGTIIPINFDVTNAVRGDIGPVIPTLGNVGLIVFVTLLAGVGLVILRRNRIS